MNLEPQDVILLGLEVSELLLPPGVLVVVANRRFTQSDGATENLDIAICGSQDAGVKFTGPQVKQLQLGFNHSQTAQDQQKEGTAGGHGFTGGCGGGTAAF